MDTQRWELAGSIFERLLGTPEEKRELLLQTLCGADAELKDVVISMLQSESSAVRFERGLAANELPTATVHAADNPDSLPGGRVGPWLLVRKIDAGGMGEVWLGERVDGQFEQRAAIKLIKRGMDSEAVLKRFLRERQILARLVHPHIAHLLDGGISADGRPYFAMEYVEGLPLLRYCHDRGMHLEERIRLFLRICEAVQFAHVNHVVHRDLKPSNILVTAGGDVKLLDFGIAKLLAGDAALEETITELQRERPMTPMYAAPEQIRGERITEATDVYALGCVLYEVLTGQHARDVSKAANIREVQQIVETTDPVAPSRLKLASMPVAPKRLRGDLDTIVLTALRREPARRYASAAAFAADLKSFLDGKPILARGDSVFYRGYKLVRRHNVGVMAAVAVVAIGAAAMFFELRERNVPPPLSQGASLAIADFNNLSQGAENAWLAPALAEMLATEVTAGSKVHVLPDELVRSARTDLAAPMAGGYSSRSLATLRKRLGADYVLSGSYLVSGGAGDAQVRLDLALQDTRNGFTRATVEQSGPLTDLARIVERAGYDVRGKAGFAPASLGAERSTDKAQPPNTEVARRMGLALDALRTYDPARARAELTEAVALAPSYAPAYLHLAQAWKALGYDSRALAAAQQAAAHSKGLPRIQVLSIEREVAVQKSDWSKAVELDLQLRTLEPDNPERHLALVGDLQRAGLIGKAKTALDEWRKLPGSGEDPRVDIEARKVASLDGDQQAAVRFAEQALRKAQARDETGLAAAAKVALVSSRDYLGQRDGAEAMLAEAIDDYRRIGNPHGEADAHLMLAVVRAEQSQGPEAQSEFQSALEIYQRTGDQLGVSNVYKNLFVALSAQGDRDAAALAAQHALEIGHEIGDLNTQAFAAGVLALMRLDDGAGDSVMKDFRDAIDLNERAGDVRQRIDAQVNYSEGLRLRGDLTQAQEVCAQALAAAEKLAEPYYVMSAQQQCAAIVRDQGNTERALAEFTVVRNDAEREKDAVRLADAAMSSAQIRLSQSGSQEVCADLEKAADAYARAESTTGEANARGLLALCWNEQGRTAERDKAIADTRELRSRVTTRREVFIADVALAHFPARPGIDAAATLHALADDAGKRQWTAYALEARLAEWRLRTAKGVADPALRAQLEVAAREKGFGWVLARLDSHANTAR